MTNKMTDKLNRLDESLVKAIQRVEKTEKTIERHFKQLEKKIKIVEQLGLTVNVEGIKYDMKYRHEFKEQLKEIEMLKEDLEWEDKFKVFDVTSKLEDIFGAYRKLDEQKRVVRNWEEKRDKEIEKQMEIAKLNKNVPKVIQDFVDEYYEMVREWMLANDVRYLEGKLTEQGIDRIIKRDKEFMIYDFVSKVQNVVGVIQDAEALSVGEKGQLNCYVTGSEGKCEVRSVACGGWNIQCYHIRTIVIPM